MDEIKKMRTVILNEHRRLKNQLGLLEKIDMLLCQNNLKEKINHGSYRKLVDRKKQTFALENAFYKFLHSRDEDALWKAVTKAYNIMTKGPQWTKHNFYEVKN